MFNTSEHGNYLRLGNYVQIKTGKLDANASVPDGQYPFFTCASEPLKIDAYSYDCECVLVSGNGDLNVKYYSGKFDAYQRTYIIESLNPRFLDNKFLYFFLSLYIEQLRYDSIGGIIKYIKLENLTDAAIPIVSLEKQRKVITTLEKADRLRRTRRYALELSDTYLRSVFLEMFGDPAENPKSWKISELNDVCNKVTDGTHQPPVFTPSGIPFIFVQNIAQGEIDFSNTRYVSEETYHQLTRNTKVDKGDIIYSSVGVSFGVAVQVSTNRKFTFQRHIAHLKPKHDEVNSVFLSAQMNNPFVYSQAARASRGAAQPTVNLGDIKEFKVIIPPLPLQEKFAAIVQKSDRIRAQQRESLRQAEHLFQTILHRAFRGEL